MSSIYLIFLSHFLMANTFTIDGEVFNFEKSNEILVSCPQKKCEAFDAIKNLNKEKIKKIKPENLSSSIGSLACRQIFNSISTLGVDTKGNGKAFCVFNDSSLIEINSLSFQIEKMRDLND